MYGAPYIFYFVLPIVKRVKIMVQRVDFEQIRQLLCPATVCSGINYLSNMLGFVDKLIELVSENFGS